MKNTNTNLQTTIHEIMKQNSVTDIETNVPKIRDK